MNQLIYCILIDFVAVFLRIITGKYRILIFTEWLNFVQSL